MRGRPHSPERNLLTTYLNKPSARHARCGVEPIHRRGACSQSNLPTYSASRSRSGIQTQLPSIKSRLLTLTTRLLTVGTRLLTVRGRLFALMTLSQSFARHVPFAKVRFPVLILSPIPSRLVLENFCMPWAFANPRATADSDMVQSIQRLM
jgi:hypothetical protein